MHNVKGFSISQSILGIVIMSIGVVSLNASLYPIVTRSVEPIHMTKASFLAASMTRVIVSKPFDETSKSTEDGKRCNETDAPPCTSASALGAEHGETNRDLFDDIDDYHGFSLAGNEIIGLNSTDSFAYNDYRVTVSVAYDGDLDGSINESGITEMIAKRIDIKVSTPSNDNLDFSVYAFNH